MVYPWEKQEVKDSEKWSLISKKKKLIPINCISGWVDICGYGSILKKNNWDISKIQEDGFINLLNEFHIRCAHPFITLPPVISEKILILNDGLARTCDILPSIGLIYTGHIFIIYLRELFFSHVFTTRLMHNYGLGLRTVLAGGERIQYSGEIFTGHSILMHDAVNISSFGKNFLETNFLYNPAEFQMNTAFAKAFSIDQKGSKAGFNINNFYIERSFWNKCDLIPFITHEIQNKSISISYNNAIILEIYFSNTLKISFQGIDLVVDEIEAIKINIPSEKEEIYFDISKF